jgi:hypothetical protein
MLRAVVLTAGLLAAVPAIAGETMSVEEARRFVVGKMFTYTCFEGTRGQGRILHDGSVVGSIQFQGAGQLRYAALPAGTVQVKNEAVCASVRGMPFSPCFNLTRLDERTFRGAISGFGFASCEFTRLNNGRRDIIRSTSNEPLRLRPSITANASARAND